MSQDSDTNAKAIEQLSGKVDGVLEEFEKFRKIGDKRAARDRERAMRYEACLNQIKEDTAPLRDLKKDVEHSMRLAKMIRCALVWFASYVVIPIAMLVAGLYLMIHGNWPAWYEWIKSALK